MHMIYKSDAFFVLWVYRFLWFLMEFMIEFPIQTSTWRILFLRWSFDCVILYMCKHKLHFIYLCIYCLLGCLFLFLQLINERVVNLRRNETVQCVMDCISGCQILLAIRWVCLIYYDIYLEYLQFRILGWVYFLEYASVFRWFFHHKLGFLNCV